MAGGLKADGKILGPFKRLGDVYGAGRRTQGRKKNPYWAEGLCMEATYRVEPRRGRTLKSKQVLGKQQRAVTWGW